MWKFINKMADEALAKYPTTLDQDVEILQKEDKEPFLGFNKRNCVVIRSQEKEILLFLKWCAEKVDYFSTMS